MKRLFNALLAGAIMAACVALGPPALASPTMGTDLIAAYNQSTTTAAPAPYDAATPGDFDSQSVPATASTAARSPAAGERLTYSPNNCPTATFDRIADASGVVGPGWRSPPL